MILQLLFGGKGSLDEVTGCAAFVGSAVLAAMSRSDAGVAIPPTASPTRSLAQLIPSFLPSFVHLFISFRGSDNGTHTESTYLDRLLGVLNLFQTTRYKGVTY